MAKNKPAPKPAKVGSGVTKKPIPGVPTPNVNRPVPNKPAPDRSNFDAKQKAIAELKEAARKADESRQIVRPAKP
jgi:hypothetical protein